MKSKWTVTAIAMLLIIAGCWTKIFIDERSEIRRRNPEAMAQEIVDALNEVKPGWEKKSATMDTPVTFSDDAGHTIVYHILETTRYGSEQEIDGLDMYVLGCVIEVSEADNIRECAVNETPAILCEKKDRAYLCWTVSSQYSFVIEYTPEAVHEKEIFRMAGDVQQSTAKE